MNVYYELHLPAAGFDPDILSGVLHEEGCSGIQELPGDRWIVYLSEAWTAERLELLRSRLLLMNSHFPAGELHIESKPERDWNAEWRKHFTPLPVTGNLWIYPPWEAKDPQRQILTIDPQMAFGTGHHETTALMLQMMEHLDIRGKQVLDLGCGSGILAFYARILGAAAVLAIDNDPDAIDNARHNLQLNHLQGIDFQVADSAALTGLTVDLVLANIQWVVLQTLAGSFRLLVPPGGEVLLSGLLLEEEERVTALYTGHGFQCESVQRKNEWIAILFRRGV